jgi:hypothetical protein
LRKAGLWEEHGLIFPSEVGTPMSGRYLYRAFKIRVKRAASGRQKRIGKRRSGAARPGRVLGPGIPVPFLCRPLYFCARANICATPVQEGLVVQGLSNPITEWLLDALGLAD